MLCVKILLMGNIRIKKIINKCRPIGRCFLQKKDKLQKILFFDIIYMDTKQKESIMLTLIFIILKLAKVVNWSWWWILLTLALDGGVFGRIL